jgi:transaldolase
LWHGVGRPNVLIKIPGTLAGLPAIRRCLAEEININVTLLFGLPRYLRVAHAYIEALESLAHRGRPLHRVASVASFFLSRIDVLLDPILEKAATSGSNPEMARELEGQIAIACAKVAYQMYHDAFDHKRFAALARQGARTQRLLWASTGTKNPAYRDVKYVEPLIGPDTVNTMPLETLEAYRDHGDPASRLEDNFRGANHLLSRLNDVGIVLDDVTRQLEEEGIEKFCQPYDKLLTTLRQRGAK